MRQRTVPRKPRKFDNARKDMARLPADNKGQPPRNGTARLRAPRCCRSASAVPGAGRAARVHIRQRAAVPALPRLLPLLGRLGSNMGTLTRVPSIP